MKSLFAGIAFLSLSFIFFSPKLQAGAHEWLLEGRKISAPILLGGDRALVVTSKDFKDEGAVVLLEAGVAARVVSEFKDRVVSNGVRVAPDRFVFRGISGALYLCNSEGKILRIVPTAGDWGHWSEPWVDSRGQVWSASVRAAHGQSRVSLEVRDAQNFDVVRSVEWEGTWIESPWGELDDGTVLVSSRRSGFSAPELRWVSADGVVRATLALPCLPRNAVVVRERQQAAFVCDLTARVHAVDLAAQTVSAPTQTQLMWSSWSPGLVWDTITSQWLGLGRWQDGNLYRWSEDFSGAAMQKLGLAAEWILPTRAGYVASAYDTGALGSGVRRKLIALDRGFAPGAERVFQDFESVTLLDADLDHAWLLTQEGVSSPSKLCRIEWQGLALECQALSRAIVSESSMAARDPLGRLWLSFQDERKPDLSGVLVLAR